MSPNNAITLIAIAGLLASCGRTKTATKISEPDNKYNGIVWVRVRGAEITVPSKEAEEWAIRQAIFLYQTRGVKNEVCYLEILSIPNTRVINANVTAGPPPPPPPPPPPIQIEVPQAILDRLKLEGRNAKRKSECDQTDEGVIDKASGIQEGDIYTIWDMLWISPVAVEVRGGWWAGPEGSTSNTYYLRKVNGVWKVIGDQMDSIS